MVIQQSHAESQSSQQDNHHQGGNEQSNGASKSLPPNTEGSVASNPFGPVPNDSNPSPTASSHQSSAESSNPPLEPRPRRYHSLPSGTPLCEDIDNSGQGKLSVSNQTNLDANVRLYNRSTLQDVRCFFVKAKSSSTATSIPEGEYTLAYTIGLDWVAAEETFRWNPSYHEFDRNISYSEQSDTERIRYDEISVTLHPVMGGNVRTKTISRSDFLKGHRHIPQ